MKIEFETDEIKTLAETVDNSLPVKINIGEYQADIKSKIVMLPKNCTYRVTIEVVND